MPDISPRSIHRMTQPWTPVDPLGEALYFLRMSGTFYSCCEFTAPWGLVLPAMTGTLMFHVVTSGQCWLEVEGADPRPPRPGDLTLVPHGEGHRLTSDQGVGGVRLEDVTREDANERFEVLRQGGGGSLTPLVCGTVRFDHPAAQHLVSLLPRMRRHSAGHSNELSAFLRARFGRWNLPNAPKALRPVSPTRCV